MFYTLKLQKNYFPTDQNTRITKEKKILLKVLEICAWWEQKRDSNANTPMYGWCTAGADWLWALSSSTSWEGLRLWGGCGYVS